MKYFYQNSDNTRRQVFHHRTPPKELPDNFSVGWLFVVAILLLLGIIAVWMLIPTSLFSFQEISGKIIDPEGVPLKDVRVSFLDENILTDESGNFLFSFPAKDSVALLHVQHPALSAAVTRQVFMKGDGPNAFRVVLNLQSSPEAFISENASNRMTPAKTSPEALSESKKPPSRSVSPMPRALKHVQVDLSWSQCIALNKQFSQQSFVLTDLETYISGKQRKFAGVWQPAQFSYRLWKADNWKNFLRQHRTYDKQGFRITDLEIYQDGRRNKFIGVWCHKRKSDHRLWVGLSWPAFLKQWKTYTQKKYVLIDAETYPEGRSIRYAGIWQANTTTQIRLWKANSSIDFIKKVQEGRNENFQLIDLEIFRENQQKKYLGVWRQDALKHRLWLNETEGKFLDKHREFQTENLSLIDLEIQPDMAPKKFSGVWGRP